MLIYQSMWISLIRTLLGTSKDVKDGQISSMREMLHCLNRVSMGQHRVSRYIVPQQEVRHMAMTRKFPFKDFAVLNVIKS